ncbi:MAG: hypothetical protein JXR37_14575 [Kiritimatiellae bacterium]|nr:hypothetical protein [Kiritimatiellia bacterium]
MKKTLLLGCVVAALGCWLAVLGAPQEAAEAGKGRIALELDEGSFLVGLPAVQALKLHLALADLDVPLAQIQTVQFTEESKEAIVHFVNGDKLTGQLECTQIELTTVFGKVVVPIEYVERIRVEPRTAEPARGEPEPGRHPVPWGPQRPVLTPAQAQAARIRCINNLRQIDGAKEQWAMAENQPATAHPRPEDISPYIKGGWKAMVCPAGGKYTINRLGVDPTCSVPGHEL